MGLAKIEVTRANARTAHCGTLTSGMVGAEVSFSFDASWDGLKRIATFKAGSTSLDVLLTEDRCEIPHEVMADTCQHLMVGIYGTHADGTLTIPTVWADLGAVNRGAKPVGGTSATPTPEVWARILGMIGDMNDLDTKVKENLVAAINEVLRSCSGSDYELSAATADTLGGIKAEPATDDDTQPVRIGEDGMLYTKPGGGEVWETIVDYSVPEDCAEVFLKTDINGNPFKLKRAIVTLLLFPAAGLTSEEWPVYTVDGTVDNVYGSNHYRYGAGYIPYETGMYRLTKFEVVQMPDGVHLLTVRETKTPAAYDEDGDVNASLVMGGGGFYEHFHAKTLAPVVTEISAVGIGYYMTAIGAGTRIIMMGVRE